MSSEEYIQVYSANGQLEADMIRLMLEAKGLHVLTRQESAGAVYGLTIGRLGEVQILVPEVESLEAVKLLQAMEEGKIESDMDVDTAIDDVEEDISHHPD